MTGAKRCPACAEIVLAEAPVCTRCGYRLDEAPESQLGTGTRQPTRLRRSWLALALLAPAAAVVAGVAAVQLTATGAKGRAPAREVMDVLERYEHAYSSHDIGALSVLLADGIKRTAEGSQGCETTLGAHEALAAYEAQWSAGASRYRLVDLTRRAVRMTGGLAVVSSSYSVAAASRSPIAFTLARAGQRWLITGTTVQCRPPVHAVASLPADPTCVQYEQAPQGEQEQLLARLGYKARYRGDLARAFESLCERENVAPQGATTTVDSLTCAALRNGVVAGDYQVAVYERLGGNRGCMADLAEEHRRLQQEAAEKHEAREESEAQERATERHEELSEIE